MARRVKVNEKDRVIILEETAKGTIQSVLANAFNVTQSTISRVIREAETVNKPLHRVNNSVDNAKASALHTQIDTLHRVIDQLTIRLETLEKGNTVEKVLSPLNHRIKVLENGQKDHEKRVGRVESWRDSVDKG